MGARSRSTSFAGPYTREDGFLGYNEICEVRYTMKSMHYINSSYYMLKLLSLCSTIVLVLGTYIRGYAMESGMGRRHHGSLHVQWS